MSAFQFLTYVLQLSPRTVHQCTTQCLVHLSPKQFPSVVVFKQLRNFHLKTHRDVPCCVPDSTDHCESLNVVRTPYIHNCKCTQLHQHLAYTGP